MLDLHFFLILRLFKSLVCIQDIFTKFNQPEWYMQNHEQPIRSREIFNFTRHFLRKLSLVGIQEGYPKSVHSGYTKVFSSDWIVKNFKNFNLDYIWSYRTHGLKYLSSTTLCCKDIEIRIRVCDIIPLNLTIILFLHRNR